MSWAPGPMVGFDIESTGVDPETARIVTATTILVGVAQQQVKEWLVNPGIDIPAEASAVHGVSTEKARTEGMDPALAVAEIVGVLDKAWTAGYPVVIFNASYDITVLDREHRRYFGAPLMGIGPIVDPFVIDKHLDKFRRGKRNLGATCEHYGVPLEDAHTSTGDSLAAARLAWRLAQVFPDEVGNRDLEALHADQAVWRATWAADFQSYLQRQGKDELVDGQWPLRVAA